MKRFISIFMALLLLAMPLTACKNKPAGGESGAPAKNGNKSAQYDTLAKIKANTPATFKKEMGNIVFDGKIIVPKGDALYNITLGRSPVYYNNHEEIRDLLIDNYSPELDKAEGDEKTYFSDDQILYTNKQTGTLQYFKRLDPDIVASLKEIVESTHFHLGEEASDTEYPMYDGTKMSMKKAKKELQAFLDSFMKKYEPDFDFVIRSGYVHKMPDCDHYSIEFTVQRAFEGTVMDSKDYRLAYKGELSGNVTRTSSYLTYYITSANGIKNWFIGTVNSAPEIKSKTKLDDKFVSFESALELLRREITSLGDITLNSAEFCYVRSYDGHVSDAEEMTKITEYHANPAWTFTSTVSDEEYPPELQKYGHELVRIYVVDAVTGGVYIYYDGV